MRRTTDTKTGRDKKYRVNTSCSCRPRAEFVHPSRLSWNNSGGGGDKSSNSNGSSCSSKTNTDDDTHADDDDGSSTNTISRYEHIPVICVLEMLLKT